MFIRATRVQTPPDKVAEAISNFERNVLPSLSSAPGSLGGVLLTDRKTGSAMGITYWESARALAASERTGIQVRTEAAKSVPGTQIVNVERAEVMIMDRAAPPEAGVFVRFNSLIGDPDKQDALTVFLRNSVLPVLKAQKGYRAAIASVDRQTGRSAFSTVWNTLDDLEASEAKVAGLRGDAVKAAGAGQQDIQVEIFEATVVELSRVVAATRA